MVKAIVLLSGGLDSKLAVKLLQEQGIDIIALHFDLPFGEGCCKAMCSFKFSQLEGIKMQIIDCKSGKYFKKYMEIIKNPAYGRGSQMNPCIDCRIFMLRIAKELMKKFNADFVATGEVLDERPMSQHRGAMALVEKESGLSRKILRPLSAKNLDPTIAEEKGLVKREKLLDIQGRRRIIQMELAKKYNMSYPSPGGGCLLCEKEYARKFRDLLNYKETEEDDIKLLKIGRHFRFNGKKIIVGRNHEENKKLLEFKGIKFMPAKNIPGPITLLIGDGKAEIRKAAELTAFYSGKKEPIDIKYGKKEFDYSIFVTFPAKDEVESLRI